VVRSTSGESLVRARRPVLQPDALRCGHGSRPTYPLLGEEVLIEAPEFGLRANMAGRGSPARPAPTCLPTLPQDVTWITYAPRRGQERAL
jgi:hypothetical protein